jgi:hypothetical protein
MDVLGFTIIGTSKMLALAWGGPKKNLRTLL